MITVDQIQGHWIRRWIKAPGFEDHTTRVDWMQCGLTYADVRIPAKRPSLAGFAALAEMPAPALQQLCRAEGFAGTVTLDGDHCTWERAINWHGKPKDTDIGHIAFDAQGRMIETGVEADYTELWDHRRAPDMLAVQLTGDGYVGNLVVVGDRFLLGIDTPNRPATGPVLVALAKGEVPADTALLFDRIYATGLWRDGVAVAERATQPFMEGMSILSLGPEAARWTQIDFRGHRSEITLKAHLVAP